ncbi:MAG: putative LPS assembly protein LptD [Bacteroidales bacterium]
MLFYSIPKITAQTNQKETSLPAPSKGQGEMPRIELPAPGALRSDSLAFQTDSLVNDSLSTPAVKKKSPLEDVVTYEAQDSLVFTGQNLAYLYGSSIVKYQDIELDADEIRMSLDSSTVYANGTPDSLGVLAGTPVFKDKSGEYESKTINYNFKSQKGFITNIVTQQGEGYLTGGQTKKMQDNEFYMVNGKYTTCDHHDCPHFYLQLTKAKVKPKKNIVTGPAYLVLADVPLPLAIPFGYFPFSESYSSGIIMPTYGDELQRGFYLRDGGYYFAINDYADLALTGEIFTKGSWGVNVNSNYAWRYKFNGNFNLGYQVTVTGDKGLPDYMKMKNFRLTWSHTQDQKANPNMTLSASVNFATSGYDRNNLDSYYNANQFTENTKSSTVNMTYNFPNAPFSISATANVTQRSQDSTLAVSFPDLTFNMRRIYPFKRKVVVGKEKWFEKISLSYTGLFRNSITTKQDEFFKSSLIKDWKNGMQHTVPISSTFTVLKYINISPSINFVDRMYSNKIKRSWDPEIQNNKGDAVGGIRKDTTYGFYNVYNFNFSLSATTKLYGFYKPLPFLGDKVQMIRHLFTPSLSFSGQPDFSKKMWGAWDSYQQPDNTMSEGWKDVFYSPFDHGQFGTAPRGKSGTVTFNMQHNLEAKIKSDRDSTGVRKISLIDNLQIGGISYNFAADSLRWSDIPVSVRLKFSKQFTLQLSGSLDSYMYGTNASGGPVKIDKTRWSAGKFPRLKSTSTSFSYTLNNELIRKLFGKGDDKDNKKNTNVNTEDEGDQQGYESLDDAIAQSSSTEAQSPSEFDKDGYMSWSVPWSLTLNYGLRYGYEKFNAEKREYNRKITQNLSFSGNISFTKNWSFNFSSSYDFDMKKIAYMNCNITRDMHCWTMSAGFVPVGPYASYNFSIRVKSSLLSDLKYDKRSSPSNKMDWY